jgi:hypothetical protein
MITLDKLITDAITYQLSDTEFKADFQNHRTLTLDVVCEHLVDAAALYGKEATIEEISKRIASMFVHLNIGIDWCIAPNHLEEMLHPIVRIPLIEEKLKVIKDTEQAANKILQDLQM